MRTLRRRDWQNVLLMLSLILGVVAMHSTVACHDDAGHANVAVRAAAATPTTAGLDGSAMVAAEVTDVVPATAGTDVAAAFHADQRAGAAKAHTAVAMSGVHAVDVPGPSDPAGGHSALHDLLHLCLAVLTALLAFVAAALLAFVVPRLTRLHTVARSGRPVAGPRAPPPISVRLAQLCVLRN